MNRILFIITLFFCTIFNSNNLFAKISDADRAIASILNKDEQLDNAIKYLVEQCDPQTFHFIEAAATGNLYKYGKDAVGLVESDQTNDYFKLYPVFEKTEKIKTEDIIKVSVPRAKRLELRKIMPVINLAASAPETRIKAYNEIRDMQLVNLKKYVKKALLKENNKEAKIAGNDAINTLQLTTGNEQEQAEALKYFDSETDNAILLQNLNEYINRKDINENNRSKAKDLVSDIQFHQNTIDVFQNIFSGLSLGSILIMVALGLSIIYGLAGIINMSHGEFIMIGAYTTFCVQQLFIKYLPPEWLDAAFFIALPMSFIVTSLFGLIIERLVIKHLYHRPLESLLATWGISLILIQLARNIFGDLTSVQSPDILSGGLEITKGLILPYNRLFIIGLTIIMFIAVYSLFKKSMLGINIRAVTQNRNMSASLGINTKKVDMLTFMLGSGLAGVAGCAITLIGNVVPNMGQTYIVDSFLVVVSGGVGKLVGCVVSGFGIGIFSKIFEVSCGAVYGKVLVLVFIIIFLQCKPKGLFPDKGRIGDD